MGSFESTLRLRRSPAEGIPAGTVITATSFDNNVRYRIELLSDRPVAEGASAAVLRGRIKSSHKKSSIVALKVFRLPLDPEQSEIYRDLYRKELEAVQKLGAVDRYVLPFLGTAVVGFQPIIVSLFIANGNLLQYVERCRPFRVNRQALLIQVAEALAFLHHEAGLVHGDLKCENILISDDQKALLTDFGLSALVDKAADSATTSTAIRALNTVRFAAPELLTDEASSDSRVRSKTPASDVWAFGMVVLQAFTGTHPWPGYDQRVVILKVLSGDIHPRPGQGITARGLSDDWWKMCLECWKFEPAGRPSIQVVQAKLEAVLNPEPPVSYGSEGSAVYAAWIPGSTRAVTVAEDNTVKIWDTSTRQTLVGPLFVNVRANAIAIAPDGQQFAIAGLPCFFPSGAFPSMHSAILRWDTGSGTPLGDPMQDTSFVMCLTYSPDGKCIASGSSNWRVRLWDSSTGEAIGAPLEGHTGPVHCLAFSPDGTRIASGGDGNSIRVWDAASGGHVTTLRGHTARVYYVCYLPDNTRLVSGSNDGNIWIWNTKTLQVERGLRFAEGPNLLSPWLAVFPSGQCVVAFARGILRIWHTDTGVLVREMDARTPDLITSLVMHPDGMRIMACSLGRPVIWDIFA